MVENLAETLEHPKTARCCALVGESERPVIAVRLFDHLGEEPRSLVGRLVQPDPRQDHRRARTLYPRSQRRDQSPELGFGAA